MNRLTLLLAIVAASAAACGKKTDPVNAGATAGSSPAPASAAVSGPHASIEAYCDTVSATFTKEACFSQADQIEMCACQEADQDDVAGNVKAGGTSPNLLAATLVTVADNASDYTYCSLAVQLAGGWHVVHKAFPCAPAPISHDGGIAVTTNVFNITAADSTLSYQWTAEDGEGRKAYGIACTAATADTLTCTAPAAR